MNIRRSKAASSVIDSEAIFNDPLQEHALVIVGFLWTAQPTVHLNMRRIRCTRVRAHAIQEHCTWEEGDDEM